MNIRKLIDQLIAIQYTHGDDADVWVTDRKGEAQDIPRVVAKAWNRDERVSADVYLEIEP